MQTGEFIKDIRVISIYTPNDRALKYTEQNLTKMKRKIVQQ